MPVIVYEGPKLNKSQSEALIKGFTEVACKVIPEVPKQAYYVFIKDYPDEKIGVGGLLLSDFLAELREKNHHE